MNSTEKLPILSESPDKMRQGQVLTILTGEGSLPLNEPMEKTDFRPKEMSLRRSRILESIDPTENRMKSELPKSLKNLRNDLR